jgi:hypothetical protein
VFSNSRPSLHRYLGHEDVRTRLSGLAQRLGTNNGDGEVVRENFLGYQLLNKEVWPELPRTDRGIGLSQSQQNHAFVRPFLDRMLGLDGEWSHSMLREAAADFWDGRVKVGVKEESGVWACRILHRVHLGLELSLEEGQQFMAMQGKLLLLIGVPQSLIEADDTVLRTALGLDEQLAAKAQWLARYKKALRSRYPQELSGVTPERLTLLASNVMDSLLFAGGQSVKTVISSCIGLLYSAQGRELLPAEFALRESNLWFYVPLVHFHCVHVFTTWD